MIGLDLMTKEAFLVRSAITALVCLLVTSCATTGTSFSPQKRIEREASEVEAALLLSSSNKTITLQRASASGSRLFIDYKLGDTPIYSRADWADKLDKATKLPITKGHSSVVITPIDWHDKNPLKETDQSHPIHILTEKDWHDFRTRVREKTTPKSEEFGVVIDFLNEIELFTYYDKESGKYAITNIENKPKDRQILKSYTFAEVVKLSQPVLAEFLKEKGISNGRALFNTGATGVYSYPFAYIDIDSQLMVFLELHPGRQTHSLATLQLPRSRILFHFVKSHVTDVATRPVTTAFRLFYLVMGSVSDTIIMTGNLNWRTSKDIPELSDSDGMDLEQWEKRLTEITNRKPSKGTIEYLIDGQEFYPALIEGIQNSDKSVNIRTYIFDDDDYAVKISDILKEKSHSSDIKVLMDGLGTLFSKMEDPIHKTTGTVKPPSITDYLKKDSKVKVRMTTNPLFTGDHIKTMTIDHKTAFLGGMNIGREYRYEWHDLMVKVEGPIVDRIEHDFYKSWAHSDFWGDLSLLLYKLKPNKKRAEDKGVPMRLLYTRPGMYEIYTAKIEAIRNAKSYIYIQNAYFSDDTLLHELIKARRRGVDVRVILTTKGDIGIMNASNAVAANIMIANGIRVFIYPGMSHVKAAIFDGWICLGSANLDKLSLRINKELNIATSDKDAAERLMKKVFEPDFKKSIELTSPIPEKWYDFLMETLADVL